MGCRKLTYNEGEEITPFLGVWKGEALEKPSFFTEGCLVKKGTGLKKRDSLYPFGLPMDNNSFLEPGASANRFLYQGKEWQTELGLNLYDFHARQFDPALGRFLRVDPAGQFNSPYVGMGNNPVMTVDPDGNIAFVALGLAMLKGALVGAGISAATYTASVAFSNGGFSNWDWGQFGSAVGKGAISGAITGGIGEVFGGVGGVYETTNAAGEIVNITKPLAGSAFVHEAARATAHGLAGGVTSGGNFWSGAASGVLGSATGSLLDNARPHWQIGGASLSGGIGAELGGGDFLQGAAQGGIIAAANHLGHRIRTSGGIDRVYDKWLARSRRVGRALRKLNAFDRIKTFIKLVRTNGTYDLKNSSQFKNDLRKHLKIRDGEELPEAFTYRGKGGYKLPDLGNYNFGVLANAAGYSNNFSQFGAGIYQIYSSTSSSRYWFSSIGSQLLYGDDVRDAYFIQLGFHHLWN